MQRTISGTLRIGDTDYILEEGDIDSAITAFSGSNLQQGWRFNREFPVPEDGDELSFNITYFDRDDGPHPRINWQFRDDNRGLSTFGTAGVDVDLNGPLELLNNFRQNLTMDPDFDTCLLYTSPSPRDS